MMQLSPSAQATLLMTCHLGKVTRDGPKPLSISEWGTFASWLKERSLTPGDLLKPTVEEMLSGWINKRIDQGRIIALLSRGHALALAVEKWHRAGLWIMTRADADYPSKLKSRLKTLSPPVLFGCGDRDLLDFGDLAVIGSRSANDDDLLFTKRLGEKAATQNLTIVSGAARGVDETAMLGALGAGGKAIGVVADSLLRSATNRKWRAALMEHRLTLISPFAPEAGFNVGNAMSRNKYIYCLSKSSLVIHSGSTGGTINGAEENLQKRWVPLWVKRTTDQKAANGKLVSTGGRWCEGNIEALDITSLLVPFDNIPKPEEIRQADMFAPEAQTGDLFQGTAKTATRQSTLEATTPEKITDKNADLVAENKEAEGSRSFNFYQAFLLELDLYPSEAFTADELVDAFSLQKSQVNLWLKRATEDGALKKLTKPVRYQKT